MVSVYRYAMVHFVNIDNFVTLLYQQGNRTTVIKATNLFKMEKIYTDSSTRFIGGSRYAKVFRSPSTSFKLYDFISTLTPFFFLLIAFPWAVWGPKAYTEVIWSSLGLSKYISSQSTQKLMYLQSHIFLTHWTWTWMIIIWQFR